MHAKAHGRDSPGDAALRSQAGPARTKHAGRLEAGWSGPSGLEQRVFGGSPFGGPPSFCRTPNVGPIVGNRRLVEGEDRKRKGVVAPVAVLVRHGVALQRW